MKRLALAFGLLVVGVLPASASGLIIESLLHLVPCSCMAELDNWNGMGSTSTGYNGGIPRSYILWMPQTWRQVAMVGGNGPQLYQVVYFEPGKLNTLNSYCAEGSQVDLNSNPTWPYIDSFSPYERNWQTGLAAVRLAMQKTFGSGCLSEINPMS